MMTTHGLPSWLQKELDQLGLLSPYAVVLDELESLADYRPSKLSGLRPCNEAVGWKPSYLGEEPNF